MSIVRTVDEAVSIFTVARHYGLPWGEDIGRAQQVHCPMHADSTPSARVYSASDGGYCWTCQAFFGPCRLAAEMEGIGIMAAARLLANRYAVDLTPDVDLDEFRRLADTWEEGGTTNTPEARRAAALAVRAADQPWDACGPLLALYDVLDAGQLDPMDWLDLAQPFRTRNPLT